jgi:hypothetical protein
MIENINTLTGHDMQHNKTAYDRKYQYIDGRLQVDETSSTVISCITMHPVLNSFWQGML